jgi:hypothetical protein
MSDDPTRGMPSAHDPYDQSSPPEHPESADTEGPAPEQGRSTTVWIVIGALGCFGLIAICAVIGGIGYFMLAPAEDESSNVAAESTVEIIEQPTEAPTETPESTPTPEPTPTATPEPTPEPEPTETPEPTPEPTEAPEPTPEPEPTEAPEPTAEPEPEPEPEPEGPAIAFGDGTFVVGEDIAPGIYHANSPGDCYWERLSGFSGELDDVISNGFSPDRQIVTIEASDEGFSSSRCGTWERDAFPVRDDPSADLADGIYMVGEEVSPGTWRSEGSDGSCYWARLSGFSGDLEEVITNSFGGVGDVVQIPDQDVGFESSNCAPWVRVGD